MKKLTQQQLADSYHCEQSTVSKLKKKGVDIYSADAIRTAILAQPKRPKLWVNGCPWDDKPEQAPLVADDIEAKDTEEQIEMLEAQALAAKDYDASRFIRTKIQSLKELLQLRILAGHYEHKDIIAEDYTKIGHGIKAAAMKLQADLPGTLEGLTAAQMKPRIRESALHMLAELKLLK